MTKNLGNSLIKYFRVHETKAIYQSNLLMTKRKNVSCAFLIGLYVTIDIFSVYFVLCNNRLNCMYVNCMNVHLCPQTRNSVSEDVGLWVGKVEYS